MRSPHLRIARPILSVLAGAALAASGLVAAAAPAGAWGEWLCNGYAGCAAQGYGDAGYDQANDISYWNMYSGHNCTNYVAYRLIQLGVNADYLADGGDAKNWASMAAAHGVLVDHSPTPGSVAWWPADAPGISDLGHVAWVESVGSGGSITLSEDNYGGDFHWEHDWPGGGYYPYAFIHFTRPAPAPAVVSTTPARYVPLAPTRILDTRTGLGAPVGKSIYTPVQVTGQGGVPTSGVTAVVVNLTVTEPSAAGWAQVSPQGNQGSSTANYLPGQTVAALTVSALDPQGRLVVTSQVPTHAVLDVEGYFTTAPKQGATLHTVDHTRLLDTRVAGGPLQPGQTIRLPVLGRAGVPTSGVSAVVLNTTVTDPSMPTYIQAYPGGTPRPNASTLNVVGGQTRANRTIVPVGADGTVAYTNFMGTADLVVDISGYFGTDSTGAYYYAQSPQRVADTRYGMGNLGWFPGFVRAQVTGTQRAFKPVAAWLTATTDTSRDIGWAAVTPASAGPTALASGTSDLNEDGSPTPNAVITALGSNSGVDVTTGCFGRACPSTAVILDLDALFGIPVR